MVKHALEIKYCGPEHDEGLLPNPTPIECILRNPTIRPSNQSFSAQPMAPEAMLGGSCTLIGSSHCLVARESVDKSLYEMSFFDLSYSGTVLALATFIVMDLLLPFLSSSAGCAETETSDADRQLFSSTLSSVVYSLFFLLSLVTSWFFFFLCFFFAESCALAGSRVL